MKLTKPILKRIIKESLKDEEYKERLLTIFKAGNHQQAIELSKQVGMEDFLLDVDLRDVDLTGADLHGVNLQDFNLGFSDLYNTNLRGANLRGANLILSDLSNADLSGADLRDAELKGIGIYANSPSISADLTGANLENIKYNKNTVWPKGFTP
jgi:uncharacterized protein YjbI with pentapeptide repeats